MYPRGVWRMNSLAWVIARASSGEYHPDCLRYEARAVRALRPGEVLLRTLYVSLDPTSRNWLKLDPRSTYLPLAVGDVMLGQTVAVVELSADQNFSRGDVVTALSGWETLSIVPAERVRRVSTDLPLETHLTIFSHIGLAATAGMLGVAAVRPGERVVVSAAAGATGSLAAQIAKGLGAHVVGIAGGPEKCRRLLEEYGLDAAIDYKAEDLDAALARHCPDGVDVFFDNVGGSVLDAVLMHLARGARIAVCGQIASYDGAPRRADNGVHNLMQLVFREARMQGFLAVLTPERTAEYHEVLLRLYRNGKLLARSHIIKGLERAPEALRLLFSGDHHGKLIVEVAKEPT